METTPRNVTSLDLFDDWLDDLRDAKGKGQIEARINKLRRGLLGEYDNVGDGVLELILDNQGPGYRVYCVDDGAASLLIWGGTKRTQNADIAFARKTWLEVKKANHGAEN